MVTNRRTYGKSLSMPVGIGIGVGISMLVLLLGCAVIAALLNNETIGMDALGYGAVIILLASSYIGALTASCLVKRRKLLVCTVHAGLTLGLLLLINGMLFGGSVSGLGATTVLLMGGGACAALTNMERKGRRRSKLRIRSTG